LNELEPEPPLLAPDVLATPELSPVDTLGALPEELLRPALDWTCWGTSPPEDPPPDGACRP
jgi:hypothetical protein